MHKFLYSTARCTNVYITYGWRGCIFHLWLARCTNLYFSHGCQGCILYQWMATCPNLYFSYSWQPVNSYITSDWRGVQKIVYHLWLERCTNLHITHGCWGCILHQWLATCTNLYFSNGINFYITSDWQGVQNCTSPVADKVYIFVHHNVMWHARCTNLYEEPYYRSAYNFRADT